MATGHEPQEIDGVMCVWLQAVGWHPAVQADELGMGDIVVYNYGNTGEVLSIVKRTAKQIVLWVLTSSGTEYKVRYGRETWKPTKGAARAYEQAKEQARLVGMAEVLAS